MRRAGDDIVLQAIVRAPKGVEIAPRLTFHMQPMRAVLAIGDVVVGPARLIGIDGIGPPARLGLATDGEVRLEVLLGGPVRVRSTEVTRIAPADMGPFQRSERLLAGIAPRPPGETTVRLTVTLAPGSADEFATLATADPARSAPPAPSPSLSGPRKVVVLDPGHGGSDPGAVASSGFAEKTIVLAVAREVRRVLEGMGRYDVRMTRDRDAFVSLGRRVAATQEAEADVFVSLHADAVGAAFAGAIRGASVYTLSDRASSQEAHRLAELENAADEKASDRADAAVASDIRDILIDLTRAATASRSADLRQLVIAELDGAIRVARDPARAAAFRVLRQPRTPAVLVELGYMTNPKDQALMVTAEWQTTVATVIATAIDRFLTRTDTAALPR